MATKPREDLSDRITVSEGGMDIRLTQATIADVVEKMVEHYVEISGTASSTREYMLLRDVDWTLNVFRNYYTPDLESNRGGLAETIANEVNGYLQVYEQRNPSALFRYKVEARMKKGFRNSSRLILLFSGVAAAEFFIAAGNAVQGNKEEAVSYLIHGMEMLAFGFVTLSLRNFLSPASPTQEALHYRVTVEDMQAVLDDRAAVLQEKLGRPSYAPA